MSKNLLLGSLVFALLAGAAYWGFIAKDAAVEQSSPLAGLGPKPAPLAKAKPKIVDVVRDACRMRCRNLQGRAKRRCAVACTRRKAFQACQARCDGTAEGAVRTECMEGCKAKNAKAPAAGTGAPLIKPIGVK